MSLRHVLQSFKKRLPALEKEAAKEGIAYTETQLAAPKSTKRKHVRAIRTRLKQRIQTI